MKDFLGFGGWALYFPRVDGVLVWMVPAVYNGAPSVFPAFRSLPGRQGCSGVNRFAGLSSLSLSPRR